MSKCHALLLGCLTLLLVACSSQPAPRAMPSTTTQAEPPLYELLARAEADRQQAGITSYADDEAVVPTTSASNSRTRGAHDAAPEPLANWSKSGRYRATGSASWLSRSLDGRRTANGDVMNSHHFTAAHRTLPLGSYARVTNLGNGRQVIVKINDRGPFNRHLLIDVTHAAANELGMIRSGKARVRVEAVSRATARAEAKPLSQSATLSGKAAKSMAPVKGKRIQVASGAHKEKLVAEGKRLQARLGLPYQVRGQGSRYRLILGPVSASTQQRALKKIRAAGYPQAFLIN
ncbi:septal ring lytic transglycosylase RlpA family protein [Aeromonas diversa]|uniref:septal ring lytic transglycosylase RlpA family protein n=1 Tax=Aeromonas diversa TaxID=502790 RepID=UPI0039A0E261